MIGAYALGLVTTPALFLVALLWTNRRKRQRDRIRAHVRAEQEEFLTEHPELRLPGTQSRTTDRNEDGS